MDGAEDGHKTTSLIIPQHSSVHMMNDMTGDYGIKPGDFVQVKKYAISRIPDTYRIINIDARESRIFTVDGVYRGFAVDRNGNKLEKIYITTEEVEAVSVIINGCASRPRYCFSEDEIENVIRNECADYFEDFNTDEFDSMLCEFLAYQ